MRLSLILSLVYLVTGSSAFALAGGYERMYYYYAYLLDWQLHTGNDISKRTIATGCKDGGKKCSFNQFITWINKAEKQVDVDKGEFPDVDKTARLLNEKELTGPYEVGRVIENTADVGTLLTDVGYFIQNSAGKGSNGLANARIAIQRVQFLRGQAQLKSLQEDLVKQFGDRINIFTTKSKLYKGAGIGATYTFFNKAATIRNNRPKTDTPNESKSPVEEAIDKILGSATAKNHKRLVDSATQARALVAACARDKEKSSTG